MTTKELFEELRIIPSGLGCMDEGCEGCVYEEKERERIEKEIEASIRKEVVEDILKLAVNTPEKVNELNVALDSRSRQELYLKAVGYWDCIKAVKEYALSKGITLK